MIGDGGAVSLRIVERRPCWQAARYAFNLAQRIGRADDQRVEVHDPEGDRRPVRDDRRRGRRDFPEVPHQDELFDALLGKIIMTPRAVPDRAGAQRVRRLSLRHGVRAGRLAGDRRQRQPGLRRPTATFAWRCSTPAARRPTSPARTWPTPRPSSWRWRCCLPDRRARVGAANGTFDVGAHRARRAHARSGRRAFDQRVRLGRGRRGGVAIDAGRMVAACPRKRATDAMCKRSPSTRVPSLALAVRVRSPANPRVGFPDDDPKHILSGTLGRLVVRSQSGIRS